MNEIREEYNTILTNLRSRNNLNNFSSEGILLLANDILKAADCYNEPISTPVVKVSKDFDIAVYYQDLGQKIFGKLFVNSFTKDTYEGNNQVIIVNNNVSYYFKRCIIAYELCFFLLNYIGSSYENNKNCFFLDVFNYNPSSKETILAREILMPTSMFLEQYNIAFKNNSDNSMLIIADLSSFFKVPYNWVEKRISELLIGK